MTSASFRLLAAAGAPSASAGYAAAQEPLRFSGAPCVTPPALHCPDKDCPSDRVINEAGMRRAARAGVVRVDQGHTEGLEPAITEDLVKLIVSAKGGRIQQAQ